MIMGSFSSYQFQMFFSLKFNVWLKWNDGRLGFQNLRDNIYQNEVPKKVARKLWTPQLVFENNNEGKLLAYEPSSVLMVLKDGDSKEPPLMQWDEAKVYDPNNTYFLMMTPHFLRFNCDFDLDYFPFDSHTCSIQVMQTLQSSPISYFRL